MDVISNVSNIFDIINRILTVHDVYQHDKETIMRDKDISESYRQDLLTQLKEKFFDATMIGRLNNIRTYMNGMLSFVTDTAKYDPADPALEASINRVKNPETPDAVIADIRNKYMGNDTVMLLLSKESCDTWKKIFTDAVYDDGKRFAFQRAIDGIDPYHFTPVNSLTTVESLLGALGYVDSVVRLYVKLRNVNYDISSDYVKDITEHLICARANELR